MTVFIVLLNRKIIQRANPVEPVSSGFIPAFDDRLQQIFGGFRIGIIGFFNYRPQLLIGEGHNEFGSPVTVPIGQIVIGGIGEDEGELIGFEEFRMKPSDAGILDFMRDAFPFGNIQSQSDYPEKEFMRIDFAFITAIFGLRTSAAAAEDGSKIDKIMFNITFSIYSNIRIHGIGAFKIDMIQPGVYNSQPSDFSSVLMRDKIVRIVFSGFFIFERAQYFTGDIFTGGGSD